MKWKKYILKVTCDVNDGDYLSDSFEITEDNLNIIKNLLSKLDKRKRPSKEDYDPINFPESLTKEEKDDLQELITSVGGSLFHNGYLYLVQIEVSVIQELAHEVLY